MYNMTSLGLVLKMVIGNNKNIFTRDDKDFIQKITAGEKYNLNKEQINALNFKFRK